MAFSRPVNWLVVFRRDTDPIEVFTFEEEGGARELYDRLDMQWTGILLCKVLRYGSVSRDQQPELLEQLVETRRAEQTGKVHTKALWAAGLLGFVFGVLSGISILGGAVSYFDDPTHACNRWEEVTSPWSTERCFQDSYKGAVVCRPIDLPTTCEEDQTHDDR